MTTANTQYGGGTNYLTHTSGFLSWALTLDHKRIGVMYLISVLTAFFFGGLAALAVRAELFSPGEQFLRRLASLGFDRG